MSYIAAPGAAAARIPARPEPRAALRRPTDSKGDRLLARVLATAGADRVGVSAFQSSI